MMNYDIEDILVWPDDAWCYRYELEHMAHKSDDYDVLYFGSEMYSNFLKQYEIETNQERKYSD